MKIASKISLSFFIIVLILMIISGTIFYLIAKEASVPLAKMSLVFVAILFLMPIAAWLLGIFVAMSVTASLRRLRKGIEIVGTGNLDHKVDTGTKDEAGQLSRAFDTMTQYLKKSTTSIESLNKEITERKKAEEKVRLASDEWERTFNSITDLIFILDKDFTIEKVNNAFAAVLKMDPKDIIGRKCYDILHNLDHPWPGCPFEKTKQDGVSHTGEVDDPHLGIPLLITVSPIIDANGEVIGAVHIAKDITEHKKAEEALKNSQEQLFQTSKLASLGQLSAGAAHEINNPLAGIVGFTEATLLDLKNQRTDPEKIAHDLKIVLKNAERCKVIISNLLNFARAKELQRQESDINSLIDDALALVEYKTAAQNIKVVKRYEKNPRKVNIDQDQMMQVLINVISNAQDAMPSGGELLARTWSEDNLALVEIKDTGKGIEKENLLRVFDPFFTTREPGQGVGLGLSISYSIMKRHEGSIEAKSDGKNKGASFIIKIPV